MANSSQTNSLEWQQIADNIRSVRRILDSDDWTANFDPVVAFCMVFPVQLAHRVQLSERPAGEKTHFPSDGDAMRILDSFLRERLTGSGNESSLQTARKLLDNAAGSQMPPIYSAEDAAIRANAMISFANIVSSLLGVDLTDDSDGS